MSTPGPAPRYPFTPGDLAKLWTAYWALHRVGNETAPDGDPLRWDELLDAAHQKLGAILAVMRAGPPVERELPLHLLGKRARVAMHGNVVVEGTLLGFGENGEFEVDDGDGTVHYCWPMLTATAIDPRCPRHDTRSAVMLLRHVCGAMMISCPQCGGSRCPVCEPLR